MPNCHFNAPESSFLEEQLPRMSATAKRSETSKGSDEIPKVQIFLTKNFWVPYLLQQLYPKIVKNESAFSQFLKRPDGPNDH